MTRALRLGALALLFMAVAGGRAGACSVMLDASRSMLGFKGSAQFSQVLSSLGGQCREHFSFGAGLHAAPADLTAVALTEPTTQLGPSLRAWTSRSHARRLVILTDNVADDGSGRTDRGQAEFYRLLKAPGSFRRVAALLMRLPFQGAIYSADDRRSADYAGGPRALMLYVLERSGNGSADPALDVDGFGLPARDIAVLALKPFEPAGEALGVRLDSGDRSVSFDGSTVVLARKSAGHAYAFTLTADVRPNPRWRFGGLPLSASLAFPPSGPFGAAARTTCTVAPDTAPMGEQTFQAVIRCVAPSALDAVDPAAQRRLGNRRIERDGYLTVSVLAHSRDIALGPALAAWSFDGDGARLADPDPRVQGAIYRLGALLSGMSPAVIRPTVMQASVAEKLYFFDAAPFLWVAFAIAILALLAALAVLLAQPRQLEVGGAREGPITRDIRGFTRVEATLDEGLRAGVLVLPGLVLVTASGETPRLLRGEGGEVWLGRSQRRLSVRVTRARKPSPKSARGLQNRRR